MNINYSGVSSDNKLIREITRIIKEDEERKKNRKTEQNIGNRYSAVSRDGDTLEISENHPTRRGYEVT